MQLFSINKLVCQLWLSSQNTVDCVVYTAEIYFLTVLEAGSPNSRYQQGWFQMQPSLLAFRQLPFKGADCAAENAMIKVLTRSD